MDFQKAIIEFFEIQHVEIEAMTFHKQCRKVRIIARKKRAVC